MEALQLQKLIASLMREIGPRLGDLHWKESTGLWRESRVLPEEAMGMLEAARTARRLREPGWSGEKGHGRWQAKKLLEWAAKELTMSRKGPGAAVWGHTGLVTEGGNGEEDG